CPRLKGVVENVETEGGLVAVLGIQVATAVTPVDRDGEVFDLLKDGVGVADGDLGFVVVFIEYCCGSGEDVMVTPVLERDGVAVSVGGEVGAAPQMVVAHHAHQLSCCPTVLVSVHYNPPAL